jgi:hypothetical protein
MPHTAGNKKWGSVQKKSHRDFPVALLVHVFNESVNTQTHPYQVYHGVDEWVVVADYSSRAIAYSLKTADESAPTAAKSAFADSTSAHEGGLGNL